MRALGKRELPAGLLLDGRVHRLARTIKHDFFAATGVYRDETGRQVVLKMGRTEDFARIPLNWLGRFLRRRELHFYRKLADLAENVPRVLATFAETGFVLEYVDGRPISDHSTAPDRFFDALLDLVREVHRRDMAYVDTNKPQNILLGADGRPHLIDFQISWDLDQLGDWWFNRWLLRRLQADDLYHLTKHKRRLRPDELTAADREVLTRKSAFIRLHRFFSKPYFLLRRRIFRRLRDQGRLLPEGSK
jgi:serine/threonine protein kinase